MKHLFTLGLLFLALTAHSLDQTVTVPTKRDLQGMKAQRAAIEKYLSEEGLKKTYPKADGKLIALNALLTNKVFRPDQTYELQSMGIVLGDALVLKYGFEWVIVTDEHGRDPALRYRDNSILVFPLTMISKRIERGEEVDVFVLFDSVAKRVEKLRLEFDRAKAPSR